MLKVDFDITPEKIKAGLRSKRLLRKLWTDMKIPLDFETFRSLYLERFEQVGGRSVKATLKKLQAAADEAGMAYWHS